MSQKLDNIIYLAQELAEARERLEMAATDPLKQYVDALVDAVQFAKLLPGEKVFTIRSKDRTAPAAVRCWAHHAEKQGSMSQTINEAIRWADKAEEWQLAPENMQYVKVPD